MGSDVLSSMSFMLFVRTVNRLWCFTASGLSGDETLLAVLARATVEAILRFTEPLAADLSREESRSACASAP